MAVDVVAVIDVAARRLALAAIRLYQRHVSPRKGFSCAWRVHRGGASCSSMAHRAIRRRGVVGGWALLRKRLRRCSEVHRAHHAALPWAPAAQRGSCDLPCDLPCDGSLDAPGCRQAGQVLDCLPCDCTGCDWPDRRQRADWRQRRQARKAEKAEKARTRQRLG